MNNARIYAEHSNGYSGCLYGKKSMTIFKGEQEVIHTGSRNVNTKEELIKLLSIIPEVMQDE